MKENHIKDKQSREQEIMTQSREAVYQEKKKFN